MRGRTLGVMIVAAMVAALMAVTPMATASVGGVVAINELMPSPTADDAEFLELRNVSGSAVDVGGWCFTSGISGCLPGGTMIAADGFLLMVQDEAIARAEWGIPLSTPVYVYDGGQKGSGETITLEDDTSAVADEVTYATAPPWPTEPDSGLASLERINPAMASSNPANWLASNPAPTPGSENTAYDPAGGPSLEILDLFATPFRPDPAQPIVVTAELSDVAPTVDLTYVVNFDTPVVMAMSLAGDTNYEATIPGQAAGDLVRFRVDAATAGGTVAWPSDDDSIDYEGVVVLNPTVVSAVPVLEWFMDDAVYDNLLANHRFDDVTGMAVMTFDGVVYDNTAMRISGGSSRGDDKVGWKVELPEDHLFDMPGLLHEPVDEFNLQRDQWPLAGQGWTVVGGAGQPEVDYHFVRQQRNGAFHGLGAYIEATDGRWRDRNDLDDGSYYNVEDSKLKPYDDEAEVRKSGDFDKKEGDENDFTDVHLLTQGIDQGGQTELDFLYDNFDIPALINYLAVISLIRHVDSHDHDYRIARDDDTQRWELLHWDLDRIFRPADAFSHPRDLRSEFPMAKFLNNRLYQSFFDYPELEELFYRRIRTMRDELLPSELHGYYADIVNSLPAEYALEDAMWGISGTTGGKIAANEARIQFQRDVIDENTTPSGPVPTSQPAAPLVVINEIQYDPVDGTDAEYVELHNLENTPIDLSGWALDDAINLEFEGGTVIPANGYLVFVRDSPTFIATYGSGVYVGGDHGGKLSNGGEQVRLLDQFGAEVDAVTYSPDPPWIESGDGPSLERIDPSGPGNDPANWGPSAGIGSPGAANTATLPVITPGGFVANPEGNAGSTVYELPVSLSRASGVPVTVDWETSDVASNPLMAHPVTDYVAAAGTVTFAPGETSSTISIEILGDTDVEPPLLYGEWGLVEFSSPTNATIDTSVFFGLGLFIIIDDD